MAKRLNITIPSSLDAWIEREVARGGFGTPSEYIRHLLRKAQVEWTAESIDAANIQGEKSGRAVAMTARDWEAIKKRARARSARIQRYITGRRKSA